MAAQDEREPGDIDMGEGLLDHMAQDEEVEQVMLVAEGEQFIPPQMDLEPEMGAAAAGAAVYDTSPPLPHQNPHPIPAETVHLSAPDIAQLFAMLAGMNEKMNTNAQQLENKMDGNTKKMDIMEKEMEANTNEMKEEIKNNTNGMREEIKKKCGVRCGKWANACRRA